MFSCDFDGQTVLIAGAGCAAGSSLATLFAGAGAQVIVMDRDEQSVVGIAAHVPRDIEALRLDPLREDHCRHFGRIWDGEPISVLLHLQALRHPGRPGRALRSIVTLNRALQAGLEAGQGSSIFLFRDNGTGPEAQATNAAYQNLAPGLQGRAGRGGVNVNAIQLPGDPDDGLWNEVFAAIGVLAGQAGVEMGGVVLPLLPRSH